MKKFFSRITSMMLVLCLVLGMTAFGSGKAYAAEKWTLDVGTKVWAGDYTGVFVVDDNADDWVTATITNITLSDPEKLEVQTAEFEENGELVTSYLLYGKKSGTSTITVDYTTPGGETGTLSKTIKVLKYPYQIKSLKVNGTKVKVSKHKYDYSKKTSKTKVKVKMALKKGWKIDYVQARRTKKSGKGTWAKVTKKMITNGSSISFPKKYAEMNVLIVMKKGSNYITYNVYFHR